MNNHTAGKVIINTQTFLKWILIVQKITMVK